MNVPALFHAVKTASIAEKQQFWQLCKKLASADPGGVAVGLTKIAYDIWADAYMSGNAPASNRMRREVFASSFGAASVVDTMIEKMASEAEISTAEQTKLSNWIAESAINDLEEITKNASAFSHLMNPRVVGGATGAAVGAGLGAWRDEDNRVRGALTGVVPGAALGALAGHEFAGHRSAQAAQAVQDAILAAAKKGRGQTGFDAVREASEYMGLNLPIHKIIAENEDLLKKHFEDGHSHLPEVLAAHLPGATARLEFMEEVKKRLPKTSKTASLQDKLADIMAGLENGGQPPMNTPASGSLEGGQEGMPPSTDPAAQAGEAIGAPPGIADGALDDEKGNKTIDNMIFLAQQVQLPQLAAELDANREALANHFAGGHAYLPPELQHHFAQSEHAEAFMKKYKQRFGAIGGGSKKTASYTFKRQ